MINFSQLAPLMEVMGLSKGKILYVYAKSQIGQKKSGIKAPILLGCVEAVNRVFGECFGAPIDASVGTTVLHATLSVDKRFIQVAAPQPGDIIISFGNMPGPVTNGHVGIVSDSDKVISNNSATGIWDEHLNLAIWKARYLAAGYPLLYYRML